MVRAGAIAFFTTIAVIPIVRRFCIRWGLYDLNGPLKIHVGAIPRLGGVAIILSLIAGVFFNHQFDAMQASPFLIGLALIWAVGFVDDIEGLSPILRLAFQIGGGVLLWYGGWRLPWFENPAINLAGVCLLAVVFTNAFNFLDGADGLCAGVTGIIAAGYIFLPGVTLSALGLLVAWSLLGASFGFLCFNFPPDAKIFMGDSGSTVFGFCIAFLGLDFCRSNAANLNGATALFPFMVAGPPLLDAALAVSRRLLGGGHLLHGDRRHFYDRLLGLGWTPRKVALTTYGLTAAICAIAGLVLKCDFRHALSLSVGAAVILLIAGLRLGSVRQNQEPQDKPDDYSPIAQ
jgi:UDP-GlcNAc:undecaprenyl-phosphate/decaprenyl-phosphate GlcNAc-1-phosphate transferase